ncbi:hypothetical protein GCM10008107_31400 [Psychrosphaera saromensis]|uniref:Sel1 repeat family protein n=1 Tax=Psychrosphaera saromensis TaxID=716813 RepID=A0A2S7UXD7_9GAMM|nr:tetratricopeptide repeat protein [Psychrosphaera saromensis]PQJ53941.1 hypothetical protein BTO11_09905 [Psychrosphaera saromensis]GHB79605.1 hypothetical protein GCM10008107_31400 [Psychrosphaera saromensis]GLQ15248.1 hypothetical protein GCM10007917_27030 [Psychrosphaera saromensis]
MKFVTALILSLLLTSCASEGDKIKQEKVSTEGTVPTLNSLKKEAQNGSSDGQYSLGMHYLKKGDQPKAFDWLEKSAKQNNTLAVNELKKIYWLEKVAGQDNILTLNDPDSFYDKVADSDFDAVIESFKTSANLGDESASFNLAIIYQSGLKNYKESALWYEKSAQNNSSKAQYNLGTLYEEDLVEGGIEKTIYWYQQAANNNNDLAQYRLGLIYFTGKAVKKDYKKALPLFEKSAEQGNPQAQYRLGIMYESGKGVKVNYKYANELLEKSAQQGDRDAQVYLATTYFLGRSVNKNLPKAKYWFEKSALQGSSLGQFFLGGFYLKGYAVTKSYEKAVFWFYKSSQQGYKKATNALVGLKSSVKLTLVDGNHAEVTVRGVTFILDSYIVAFENPYYIKIYREDGQQLDLEDAEKVSIKYIEPRGCTEPVTRRPDLDSYNKTTSEWLIGISC